MYIIYCDLYCNDVNVVTFEIYRNNIKTLFDDVFKHDDAGVDPNSDDVYSGSIGSPRNIDVFIKYLLSMGVMRIWFHKSLMCYKNDDIEDIYLFPRRSWWLIKPSMELITNIIDVIVNEI